MLTKDQWAQVEADLSYPFGRVRLLCDGHEIAAAVEREKGLRYCVAVYIDGYIRGEWYKGEPEHVRKFWREHRSPMWGAKARANAASYLKKRGLSKDARDFWQKQRDAVVVMWRPVWPNAKALCRHLRKSCTSVERIQPES